jgi:hypothetical protein
MLEKNSVIFASAKPLTTKKDRSAMPENRALAANDTIILEEER